MLEQILGPHTQAIEFNHHSSYKTVTKNTVPVCKDGQKDMWVTVVELLAKVNEDSSGHILVQKQMIWKRASTCFLLIQREAVQS